MLILYPYALMLLIAGLKKQNEITFFNKRTKLFILLICIIGIGFSFAGMLLAWTPKNQPDILGVQGRYFLPFAVAGLLTIRNSHIMIDEHTEHIIMFTSVWLELPIVFFLFRAMGL